MLSEIARITIYGLDRDAATATDDGDALTAAALEARAYHLSDLNDAYENAEHAYESNPSARNLHLKRIAGANLDDYMRLIG